MMSFGYKGNIEQWRWLDAEELNSTNDAIKELNDNEFPAVISAVRQTKGRGRRGRQWIGMEGNLYFTYNLQIPSKELSKYVCLIGLSLAKTIQGFSRNKKIQIKWPNDVFIEEKKATGILLENIKDDNWAIGIGVNIVDSPVLTNQLYCATSLKENQIKTDRITFLRNFLAEFTKDLEIYKQQGFRKIKEQWLERAYKLGQEITIRNEQIIKKGVFLTLDDNGYLILKTKQGEEKIIAGDLF